MRIDGHSAQQVNAPTRAPTPTTTPQLATVPEAITCGTMLPNAPRADPRVSSSRTRSRGRMGEAQCAELLVNGRPTACEHSPLLANAVCRLI